MNIEIQKNVITAMGEKDVIQYELVPVDGDLRGSLDDLKRLAAFFNQYIEREEGKIPANS